MKLAYLIQAWLPDISQARLSLRINLISEEGKYVRIPRHGSIYHIIFNKYPINRISYSGDLKSDLVWISNGTKQVGLQMVWISNGI